MGEGCGGYTRLPRGKAIRAEFWMASRFSQKLNVIGFNPCGKPATDNFLPNTPISGYTRDAGMQTKKGSTSFHASAPTLLK
jgi:hypothetical protein